MMWAWNSPCALDNLCISRIEGLLGEHAIETLWAWWRNVNTKCAPTWWPSHWSNHTYTLQSFTLSLNLHLSRWTGPLDLLYTHLNGVNLWAPYGRFKMIGWSWFFFFREDGPTQFFKTPSPNPRWGHRWAPQLRPHGRRILTWSDQASWVNEFKKMLICKWQNFSQPANLVEW